MSDTIIPEKKKKAKKASVTDRAIAVAMKSDLEHHISGFKSAVGTLRADTQKMMGTKDVTSKMIGGPLVVALYGMALANVSQDMEKVARNSDDVMTAADLLKNNGLKGLPEELLAIAEDSLQHIKASSYLGMNTEHRITNNSGAVVAKALIEFILESQGQIRNRMTHMPAPGMLTMSQGMMHHFSKHGGTFNESVTSRGIVLRVFPDDTGMVDLEKNKLIEGALSNKDNKYISMHALALFVQMCPDIAGSVSVRVEVCENPSEGAHRMLYVTSTDMYRTALLTMLSQFKAILVNNPEDAETVRDYASIVSFLQADATIARILGNHEEKGLAVTVGEDVRIASMLCPARQCVPTNPNPVNLYDMPVIMVSATTDEPSDLPTIKIDATESGEVVAYAVYGTHASHVTLVEAESTMARPTNAERTVAAVRIIPAIADVEMDESVVSGHDSLLMTDRLATQMGHLPRRVSIFTLSPHLTRVIKLPNDHPVWGLMKKGDGSIGTADEDGMFNVYVTFALDKMHEN